MLFNHSKYKAANNRAYYAIYYALTVVLCLESIAFKKHKDTITYFNKKYVHTEIFPREIGRKIAKAEKVRNASDLMRNATRYYKENPERVEIMCKAFEETRNDGAMRRAIDTALRMILRGKCTLEEIAEDTELPIEKGRELARNRSIS